MESITFDSSHSLTQRQSTPVLQQLQELRRASGEKNISRNSTRSFASYAAPQISLATILSPARNQTAPMKWDADCKNEFELRCGCLISRSPLSRSAPVPIVLALTPLLLVPSFTSKLSTYMFIRCSLDEAMWCTRRSLRTTYVIQKEFIYVTPATCSLILSDDIKNDSGKSSELFSGRYVWCHGISAIGGRDYC